MRIVAPTFTQTPNDLFDHWLPLLTEAELKVLLVIMRKTFGWNKQRDFITNSQFVQLTGLSKPSVIAAIKTLQEKGLVLREIKGKFGNEESYYELIVDDSNNSEGVKNVNPPSKESLPPPVKNFNPQNNSLNNTDKNVCYGEPSPVLSCVKSLPNGKTVRVFKQEIIEKALSLKKDWKESEINHAWVILCKYNKKISDPLAFIQGTIKNMRKPETQNRKKQCPNTSDSTPLNNTPSTEKSKSTELTTLTPAFREFLKKNGLKTD
jgi:phage replication O-like protein O